MNYLQIIISVLKSVIFRGGENSPDGVDHTGWNRDPVLPSQMSSGPKGKLSVGSQPKETEKNMYWYKRHVLVYGFGTKRFTL